jgi:hypothetical protein
VIIASFPNHLFVANFHTLCALYLNSTAAPLHKPGTLTVNTTTPIFDRLQNVPADEDTIIRTVNFATVGGIQVRFESWLFGDLSGRSAIFLSHDVGTLDNAEIVRMLRDAGVDVCGTVTFSRQEIFCFVNFDFHDIELLNWSYGLREPVPPFQNSQ